MPFQHDIDPLMLRLGDLHLYWYSLFLALGVLLCYLRLRSLSPQADLSRQQLDSLMLHAIVGMFVGARLGHALFYQPQHFIDHPLEIVMLWRPGLSSHGAAFGLLAAVYLWSRIQRKPFFLLASTLSLGLPLILVFARIGNFVNSEAVGRATAGDWGVVFVRLGESFPRHPLQLYESLAAVAIFLLLNARYRHRPRALSSATPLLLFGLLYFAARFLLEYWKPASPTDIGGLLTMGQALSLPPLIAALGYFVWRGRSNRGR
jgi:prolipoprotein diacylglyceryl transferase